MNDITVEQLERLKLFYWVQCGWNNYMPDTLHKLSLTFDKEAKKWILAFSSLGMYGENVDSLAKYILESDDVPRKVLDRLLEEELLEWTSQTN